jgi:hypothetical protein
MKLKLPVMCALMILAIEIQLLCISSFGWSLDLALATLIAFTAFVNLHELTFLTLLSMWLLNWQPAVGPELLAFGLIPLVAFVARKSSPWNIWASTGAFILSGVPFMYLAAGVPLRIMREPQFILNAAGSAAAGLLLLWLLYEIIGYTEERRLFAR